MLTISFYAYVYWKVNLACLRSLLKIITRISGKKMTSETVAIPTRAVVENSRDVVRSSNEVASYARLSYWNGCMNSASEKSRFPGSRTFLVASSLTCIMLLLF